MGTADNEIDFPRVAATKSSTSTSKPSVSKGAGVKRKNENDAPLFGDGTKKTKTTSKSAKKQEKTGEKKKDSEKSAVWIKPVSMDMLLDGVMGIGIVREIHEEQLLLETSDSCRVHLPVTQIGKQFTELLKADKISAEDVFTIGQMVPFRVTKKMVDNGPKGKIYPTVSCDPAKLNAHLVPSRLVAGLVIHSIVESSEEKGYVLNIGLQSASGFLPTEKAPAAGLRVGQPLVVRVESTASRVVKVTSFVEQDNLCYEACEKLQLNHLMPGTIIECEPGKEEAVAAGVYVTLGNGVRGFIARRHMPPRLRADTSRLARAIRCIVMFCQQNANLLVLSAHPDIVAVSKPDKRTQFDGYDIGDRVTCTVMDVLPTKFIVTFALPQSADGKASLVTATSSKNYLNKADECETFYKIGSEHECRIIDIRYAERSLVVATRKDILKQKMVSYKDAIPGDLVKARVVNVNTKGVNVMIFDTVRGFMPLHLISDKAVKLEKAYEVGKEFNCRILNVDQDRKQVTVTAKQSLVDFSGLKVTSYDADMEGKTTMGIICNVFPTGVALVLFYNNVKGVLPIQEAKRLGPALKRDQTIEVRIMSVNIEDGRIQLALTDENSKAGVSKPEHSEVKSTKKVFDGVITEVFDRNVGGKRLEKADITINTDSKTTAVVSLNPVAASDMIQSPFDCFKGVVVVGKKLPHLSLLGLVSGANRVTSKWFVCDWLNSAKNVPNSFDDLKEDMQVCGIITQRNGDNLFAELAGGSGLVGRVAMSNETMAMVADIQVGQTVVGRVCRIKAEKHIFNIDLKLDGNFGENTTQYALTLAESFTREVSWLAENAGVPVPGSSVSAKVSHIVDEIVFVVFNKKITGSLRKSNYKDGVKVGDIINCLVLSYTYPNLEAELVQLAGATKGKKKAAAVDITVRIVQVNRDFSLVLAGEKLYFVPNRLHPNLAPQTGRGTVGEKVIMADQKQIGTLDIALLEGDKEIIEELNNPESDVEMESDEEQKSPSKRLSSKSVRNFTVYTATVVGAWDAKEADSHYCVKIKMPGDTYGRLHVSEFPRLYESFREDAVAKFIKSNIDKAVNVKVIGFSKVKETESQVADLTMKEEKMKETRLKASAVGFEQKYKKGDIVDCFICPEKDTSAANVRAEISPIATGFIAREQLSKDDLLDNVTNEGAVVDVALAECTRRKAIVSSVSRAKGKFVLQLSLEGVTEESDQFTLGEMVTGRVTHVNKGNINVRVQLSSGQQAILGPTAISSKYDRVHQHIGNFNKGELFRLYALRRDDKPRRYFVITESRYNQYKKDLETPSPTSLLPDLAAVKQNIGKTVHGFICNKDRQHTLVEIAPGISGCIRKTNKELATSPLNSVVSVVIESVDAQNRVLLTFDEVIFTPADQVKEVAKKVTKEAVKATPDVKLIKKYEESGEKITLADPGFDWNGAGFTAEDLAAVGKIEAGIPGVSAAVVVDTNKEKKTKAKTAENVDAVENDEDFDRLLRKDPNSAEAWIKYISFFVEKSDLAKARATAERALTVINYREEAELFNVWTAYLNLEVAYGDLASTRNIFYRACGNADSLKVHKQMAAIYVANKKIEEADEIFNAMVRKFRASSDDVWYLYAEHLMSTERQQQGRDLLQRALASVPKARHPQLISRFAQLEYQLGDAERGRTLFESLVTAYQKKTDIWMVYADFALKYSGIESARQVLERACALSLNMHKLRPLFKKWMEFEEKHGDEQSRQLVRSQAQRYLSSQEDQE